MTLQARWPSCRRSQYASRSTHAPVTIELLVDRVDCLPDVSRWIHLTWYLRFGLTQEDVWATYCGRLSRITLPTCFVAIRAGQPIGVVSLIRDDSPFTIDAPCLAELYVVPEFRRHGIGSQLCQAVTEHARMLEINTLYLYTDHLTGHYQRRGWRILQEADPESHSSHFMSLDISDPCPGG